MKKASLTLIFLLFLCAAKSQTYHTGAMFSQNVFVSIKGSVSITDSVVLFKTNESATAYQIVKKSNETVYYTDGLMVHYLTIQSSTGKKKGFVYDTIIYIYFDKKQTDSSITYYAKAAK